MARFFESITLTNLLSFGPEPTTLELADVNVVVGPNGAGKSNLLEALNLLHHAPRGLDRPLRAGGGVREFLWQRGEGRSSDSAETVASIEVGLEAGGVADVATRYRLGFTAEGSRLRVTDESLRDASPRGEEYFGYRDDRPGVSVGLGELFLLDQSDPGSSILAQLQDPRSYPELTRLSSLLTQVGFTATGWEGLDLRCARRAEPTCPLSGSPSRSTTYRRAWPCSSESPGSRARCEPSSRRSRLASTTSRSSPREVCLRSTSRMERG